MNALAVRGASYLYYDGKSKHYPKCPLDNVRIIFLDMHLDEVAGGTNSTKNIVSSLVAGIEAIVHKENGPYIIMVWSKHDSQHFVELKDTLLNENSVSCKPIAVLNMEKSLCFETINSDTTKIEWRFKNDGFDILKKNLIQQLKKVDSFLILCNWENGIRNSAKQIVHSISALFDNKDIKWNDNLRVCLARMAAAYAGQSLEMTNANIIQNAYYSMNSMVTDFNGVETDKIVKSIECEVDLTQPSNSVEGTIIVSTINNGKEYILVHETKKYIVYEDKQAIWKNKDISKLLQGNNGNNQNDEIKQILHKMYWENISSLNTLLNIRSYSLELKRPGNVYESSYELKKEICEVHKIDEHRYDEIKGIELEVSPICDYAQDKRKRLRFLPGLEIPADLIEKDDSKYTYISIPIMLNGKVRRLLFDFRYSTSERLDYLDGKKTLYALGDELLLNVKENLSSHGMRNGIICID